MSATLVAGGDLEELENELRLPFPLPHQRRILASRKKRKVLRCGRRYGKTRVAFIAAIDGHGPRDPETNEPMFPGILQGGDVVWCAKDYPQLGTVLWNEEIEPRFRHLSYVSLNKNEHSVAVEGLGTLYLRPETAIGGVRGIGKNLRGVILDEAAFYDLKDALLNVILPALLDNGGWLILMSTTNAGDDGNAEKRVPSYFNVICEEIGKGLRSDDWEEFTGTAYDNPTLSKAAIDELVAEYTPGSAGLEQEVYANLGAGGTRFYTLDRDRHLVPPSEFPAKIPPWWETWGSFDWGYAHWAVFGLWAKAGNATFLVDSYWARKQQDGELAEGAVALLADYGVAPRSLAIYAGHDCWAKVTARGAPGISTADVWIEHALLLHRADIDRVNGGRAVQRALAAATPQRDGGVYIVDRPPRPGEVEMLGSSGNRRVFDQLVAAMPDKNDVNKPAKVDADSNGRGGDDGSDMFRYGVATRYREVIDSTPAPSPRAFDPAVLKHEADESRRDRGASAPHRRVVYDSDFGGF